MRNRSRLQRLARVLLAAVVLCASFAGASHAHGLGDAAAPAVSARAAQPDEARAGAVDLDCALCAAASRLAQGAPTTAPHAGSSLALQRLQAPRSSEVAPASAPLARAESRAPPRLG